MEAETKKEALMNRDFVIPSDLQISVNDIEDFTPVEAIDSNE